MSTEARLVKKIVDAVAAEYPDAWVFKVVGSPYQMTGVPDILFCVEGLLVGAEVKHQKPGESLHHAVERASPAQRLQIRRIIEAGGMAGVVTSPAEALDLIQRGLEKRTKRDHA